MSKFLRISVLILIILGIISYPANLYAVNMDLEGNNNTYNVNNETTTSTESIKQGEFTTQITVSTQELTISNALSICLIAVGIVLILLSIAILIKMKK